MKTLIIILISGISFLLLTHNQVSAQDGAELLANMDKAIFTSKDKQADVRIVVNNENSRRDERVREAILLQKGIDRKIYRYTYPEKQEGIATLSLPGDVMWMYMPAIGQPKRISLLAKSQVFSGTDFSYEDIPNAPYSERYTPTLVSSDSESYTLELIPLSNRSNYSKLLITIHKTHFYPKKIEYFDRSGNKWKEATYVYSKIAGYWNADEVTMTDLRKGSSTMITMSNVKFDQGLSDELFTSDKFYQ